MARRRWSGWSCILGLSAQMLSGGIADAQPRKGPRPPSTEAFATCREQEKVGDASACWKVWLSKWRETGSEAETAYAEEHAQPRSGSPSPAAPLERPNAVAPAPSAAATAPKSIVTITGT